MSKNKIDKIATMYKTISCFITKTERRFQQQIHMFSGNPAKPTNQSKTNKDSGVY